MEHEVAMSPKSNSSWKGVIDLSQTVCSAQDLSSTLTMAGPNLEVFKFGLYLFVPVFALLHFGDPDWYHHNVLPVGIYLLAHSSHC